MMNLKIFHCYNEKACANLFTKLVEKGVLVTRLNNDILTNKSNYLQVLEEGQKIIKEENLSYELITCDVYGKTILFDFIKAMKCSVKPSIKTDYTWEMLNDDTVVSKEALKRAIDLENFFCRKVCFKYNSLDGSIDIFVKGSIKERESIMKKSLLYQNTKPTDWDKVYLYDAYGILEEKKYTKEEQITNIISYFNNSYATMDCLLTEYQRNKIERVNKSDYTKLIAYDEVCINENINNVTIEGRYLNLNMQEEIPFTSTIKYYDEIISVKTKLKNKTYAETFAHSGSTLIHQGINCDYETFLVPNDFSCLDGINNIKICINETPKYATNYSLVRNR